MKRNNVYWLICVFVLVFSLSFLSAAAVSNDLHLNIQTTDTSTGEIVTGTFDFVFNLTTDEACTTVVYSNSTSLTTDSRGIISYYLGGINLDFSDQYYLCYYRDSVLINASKIARTPYAFRAQNITISGVEIDANLVMTGYNVTADYFIGDGSQLTNLNASAVNYWTQSGSNLYYNSGSIGIGHTGPASTSILDLNVNAKDSGLLLRTGAGPMGSLNIYSGSAPNRRMTFTAFDGFEWRTGNHSFTGSSVAMYLNGTSGNVGIGTTTPGYALDVVGSIYASSDVLAGGTSQAVTRMRTPYMTPYVSGGNFDVRNYAGDTSYLSVNTSSGRVGIGTENPSSELDILGTLELNAAGSNPLFIKTQAGNPQIYQSTADNRILEIVNTASGVLGMYVEGDVGIGTVSPNNTLHVVGDLNVTTNVSTPKLCLNGDCKISWDEAITGEGGWNDTGTQVELVTSSDNVSANTLFVDNTNSRVGVGTSTPGVALDVSGTISASSNVLATTSVQSPGYFAVPVITPYSSGGSINFTSYDRATSVMSVNTSSERVGIGTANPEQKLHLVGGNLKIEGSTPHIFNIYGELSGGSDDPFIMYSDGNMDIRPYTSLDLQVQTGAITFGDISSGEWARFTNDGDVGIGTTSPSKKLHVVGGDIRVDDGAGNTADLAQNQLSFNGGDGYITTATEGSDLILRTNTSDEVMRLMDSGNVGIGTTTPQNELNVVGEGNFTGNVYSNGVLLGGSGQLNSTGWNRSGTNVFLANSGDSVGIGTSAPNSVFHIAKGGASGANAPTSINVANNYLTLGSAEYNTDSYRIIGFGYNSGGTTNQPAYIGYQEKNITGNTKGDLIFGTRSVTTDSAPTERMRIDSDGNVGIGTTSPDYKLEIEQDGQDYGDGLGLKNTNIANAWEHLVANSGDYYWAYGTSPKVVMDTDGNFGIGTTNPGFPLEVAGTVYSSTGGFKLSTGLIDANGNDIRINAGGEIELSDTTGIGMTPVDTGSKLQVKGDGSYHVASFFNGTTEVMRITNTSLVGINTTTPQGTLDVNGSICLTGDCIDEWGDASGTLNSTSWNRSGTDVFLANSGDSVGIGTTTPNEQLEISDSTNPKLRMFDSGYGWMNMDLDSHVFNFDFQTTGALMTLNGRPDQMKVGIGNTTPVSKLHLGNNGTFDTTQGLSFGDGDTGFWEGADDSLRIGLGGSERWLITSSLLGSHDNLQSALLHETPTSTNPNIIPVQSDDDTGMGWAGHGVLSFIANGTNVMNVNASNVGIGTVNPVKKFQVNVADDNDGIYLSKSGAPLVKIEQNGGSGDGKITIIDNSWNTDISLVADANSYFMNNLGIGTASPNNSLHVVGTTNITGDLYVGGTDIYGDTTSQSLRLNSGAGSILSYGTNTIGIGDNTMSFTVLGDNAMKIMNDGDVGVGTILPQQKLHVNGSILANGTINATTDVCIEDGTCLGDLPSGGVINGSGTQNYVAKFSDSDTVTNSIIYDDGSNVGIGTASPGTELHVIGDVNASGAYYAGTQGYLFANETTSGMFLNAFNDVRFKVAGTHFMRLDSGRQAVTALKFQSFYNGSEASPMYSFVDDQDTGMFNDGNKNNLAFTVGGSEAMRIYNNSYVGIGNTTPVSKLQISNNGTYAISQGLTFGDGDTGIYESADDTLNIKTPSSGWFKLDSGYFMGAYGNGAAIKEAGASLTVPGLLPYRTDTNTGVGGDSFETVALIGAGTTGLVYNGTSGNVGIGTTTPDSKLQVYGGDLKLSYSAGSDPFYLRAINDALWFVGDGAATQQLVLAPTYSHDSAVHMTYTPGTLGEAGGLLKLGQTSKNAYNWTHGITALYTNGTERLRIDAMGNVGIGTTTPQNTLNVIGDGNFTGNLYTNGQLVQSGSLNSTGWNRSGTNVFLANSGDSVGIGTTSPATKLDVVGGEAMTSAWTGVSELKSTTKPMLRFNSNDVKWGGVGYDSATGMQFYVDSSNSDVSGGSNLSMTILNSGNVGIGTTSPSYKLDVESGDINIDIGQYYRANGNRVLGQEDGNFKMGFIGTDNAYFKATTSDDLSMVSNENTYFFLNGTNGNVGIGTTSPTDDLHLYGAGAGGNDVEMTIEYASDAGSDANLNLWLTHGNAEGAGDPYISYRIDDKYWVSGVDNSDSDNFKISYNSAFGTNDYFNLDTSGNVGIGTTTPFSDVGTSSGDFSGKGLHINNSGAVGRLILEAAGPVQIWADSAGGANDKMLGLYVAGGVGKFRRYDDNTGVTLDNILVMDLGTGYVGINTTTPQNTMNIVGDLNVTGTIYGGDGAPVVNGSGTDNYIPKWDATGEGLEDSSAQDTSEAFIIEI